MASLPPNPPPDDSSEATIKNALNKAAADYIRLKKSEQVANEQLAVWLEEIGRDLAKHAESELEKSYEKVVEETKKELNKINIFYMIAVVTVLVIVGNIFIYYIQSEVHQSEMRVLSKIKDDNFNSAMTPFRQEIKDLKKIIKSHKK